MSWARAVWARMDWRGLTLLSSGAAWVGYGAQIATDPRYGTVRGISVLLNLMPVWAWGALWVACGIISAAYCLMPADRDRPGVAAAMAPPLLWSTAYTLGASVGGESRAGGSIVAWASHALIILVVAVVTRPRKVVVIHA
ncbi:hypothetical protein [Streptomyces seoulensis]|uniref:hypothetical protein n=1 Tax=Streptomyces seoulensis TaxID=73044 RepID=UPI001FCAD792|nr:hypothetical protein [Streptomyces seoulensis]